ncbi:MAG: 2,3-bisphosphoglycerate-independent phosphoglycerate mutase [Clostridiales bacterium]|jgi:2,3-bisphosphoglycerate-independent phosphoglycerate mutase|nr:2,3-bisphosphoglycerate-independent phosphoglycerate mutase [Clostridiales bacterium]
MTQKPTVLMILDGFGLSDNTEGNAIKLADTPNLDHIFSSYPWEKGYASGLAVGLPDGQMGNSEVGHLNIGAGRVVYQELTRITKSIHDGDFFENPVLVQAIDNCKNGGANLHMFGLLSDGGVHSHNTHLYALLEMAKRRGVKNVYIHAFLDGRDTPPTSGKDYLLELESRMKSIGVGRIATISGRYYAMDRDNRWERVVKAYDALVFGEGDMAGSASECMDNSYGAAVNDEFVAPTVIRDNGSPVAVIKPGDSVIFYNFRPDRAREITRAFCDPDFKGFERRNGLFPLTYVCFTEYDVTIPNKTVVFTGQSLTNTFGEYISSRGLKQLRLAETEKYAHVTFFFNGGVETPYPGEDRILVPSPKVATYDLQPEMSAFQVTDKLVEAITSQKYDVIIINYANSDMVGHTGVLEAAIKAVEAVDSCIGRMLEALLSVNGQMFICADHGNSDKMIDEITCEPFTAHTTNPVPFIIVNAESVRRIDKGGKLCDITPTLLELMDIPKPKEMTGRSLVIPTLKGDFYL